MPYDAERQCHRRALNAFDVPVRNSLCVVEEPMKIFSLAIRDGKAGSNPCRQVQKYEEHNERNRCLTQEEEDRLLSEMSGARAPQICRAARD